MPRYDFECTTCDHRFELVEKIADHDSDRRPPCPACGGNETRRIFSPVFAKTSRKS